MYLEAQTCAECAMDRSAWKDNEGLGYRVGGEWYCCEGCAEDLGCACMTTPEEGVIGETEGRKP